MLFYHYRRLLLVGLLSLFCGQFSVVNALTSESSFGIKGLEYHIKHLRGGQFAHVLIIDPEHFNIAIQPAQNHGFGRATVAEIAREAKAVAAINGGFFKTGNQNTGLPAGILRINQHWFGIAYKTRAAIGWSKTNKAIKPTVLIDRLQTRTTIRINHKTFPLNLMNMPAKGSQAALYTDSYSSHLYSNRNALDVVVSNDTVTHIAHSEATPIPMGGFVYSISEKQKHLINQVSEGDSFEFNINIFPQLKPHTAKDWEQQDFILGGAPLLIFDGQAVQSHSIERLNSSFIHDKYARTAVGILKNNNWLFLVLEENAFESDQGLSLTELTNLLLGMGCQNAINLDGGTSSTLYFSPEMTHILKHTEQDTLGVNFVRRVANAIVILPKQD